MNSIEIEESLYFIREGVELLNHEKFTEFESFLLNQKYTLTQFIRDYQNGLLKADLDLSKYFKYLQHSTENMEF
jgi:hypothetical protein